ncbi:MAG: hypothetical protein ACD_46C00111G0001 [uncultured bacterium]|nr:MAG: hypothetical protein ACD_46C00111G0001 [uncultured bacterium]
MFGRKLKQVLENVDKHNSQFLLIGEDHRHSSALVGLAHHADIIENSGKKVIVVTENLKRLNGFFSNDATYSRNDIRKSVPEKDKDKEALLRLVKANIEVHGLESKKTAPGLFLKGKSKQTLLIEAKTVMPYIFNKKEYQPLADMIEGELKSEYCDVEDFRNLLNRKYADTNERIIEVNREITKQLTDLHKRNPEALIIFSGGAAHLPEVKQNGKVIEQGLVARMEQAVGKEHVYNCFISSLNYNNAYKPHDPHLDIGLIHHVFKEPNEFPALQEKKNENKEYAHQTANIFLNLNQKDKLKAIENIHENKKLSLSNSGEVTNEPSKSDHDHIAVADKDSSLEKENDFKAEEETIERTGLKHK